MANKANTTIAFTLPISCQICLGKVKSPVVCSNLHVFCGTCLEVWLEHNSVCPTCRVPVHKPCRPVLGGLNPQVEKVDNFSDSQLRRSRMELIYKEYENEISRLEAELTATKEENKSLRSRIGQGAAETKPATSPPDRSMITTLNNKLKEATDLYDRVRRDMDKMRMENLGLRNMIQDVNREKQSLKLELGNRSPRKFGRYTVAALESRLESSQKQVTQLERALEKSDSYLADLESDLHSYKLNMCSECKSKVLSLPTKSKQSDSLNLDSSTFDVNDSSKLDSELPSKISTVSDDDSDFRFSDSEKKKRLKDESFDLDSPKMLSRSSFVLEQPSSMTEASDLTAEEERKHARGRGEGSNEGVNGSAHKPETYKKKLRFLLSDEDDTVNQNHNAPSPLPRLVNVPPVPNFSNAPPASHINNALPVPHFSNALPEPQTNNALPVPNFSNAPPVSHLNNAQPVPHFSNAPPVSQMNNALPVPHFSNAPPVPQMNNALPVPNFSNAPPVSHLNNALPLPQLTNAPPELPSIPGASQRPLSSANTAGSSQQATVSAPGIFRTENSILNMSTTEDIDDCMRLMDEAQKKVEAFNQNMGSRQTAMSDIVSQHRATGCPLNSEPAPVNPGYTPYSSSLPPGHPLTTPTVLPAVVNFPSAFTSTGSNLLGAIGQGPALSAGTGHQGPSLSAMPGQGPSLSGATNNQAPNLSSMTGKQFSSS